jgi:hypothetical protein
MNIISPDNYFARLFFHNFEKEVKDSIRYFPSSLITSELLKDESSVALIPAIDLIKNPGLHISKLFGISFEGSLSNSYIYYGQENKNITEINLAGDMSSCEVILSKILFKELYDSELKIVLSTSSEIESNKNYIITGNKNFDNDYFVQGFSFAEEMVELINLPYVNYIVASKNPDLIKEFNSIAGAPINKFIEKPEEAIIAIIPLNIQEYFAANVSNLIFKYDEQDIEGIVQLLQLPYFHGLINDIVVLNLV